MDETARAYATLGVPPGSSLAVVRKQYKALVRKWHPDRFSGDAQGQVEATLRMRAINDAFRSVAERSIHATSPGRRTNTSPPDQPYTASRPSPPFGGRRLSREEIDRMVEAMKNDGPLDWILEGMPPVEKDFGRKVRAGAWALAVALVPALFTQAFRGLPEGVVLWTLLLTGVAAFAFFLRVLPKE